MPVRNNNARADRAGTVGGGPTTAVVEGASTFGEFWPFRTMDDTLRDELPRSLADCLLPCTLFSVPNVPLLTLCLRTPFESILWAGNSNDGGEQWWWGSGECGWGCYSDDGKEADEEAEG